MSDEPAPDATIDYWPILRQSAAEIMRQVEAGEHDAYLAQLGRMEAGHRGRQVVLQTIHARLDQPPKTPETAKSGSGKGTGKRKSSRS